MSMIRTGLAAVALIFGMLILFGSAPEMDPIPRGEAVVIFGLFVLIAVNLMPKR